MDDDNIDLAEALVSESIAPALWDDFTYKNEDEFNAIKRYIIDAIRDIEYIDQGHEEQEYEE